jgi:hypothetical protein
MATAKEYSVGVAAPAFPRDPVNVNVYLEHVLIGQTLEPLFTLGDDGLIKGAIAEKWEFNSDHNEVTVYIRKNIFFSNGNALTTEDIKFSIERHSLNNNSQSYNYLRVIKSIEVVNSSTIKFHLHNKYVPFLLTLSRDQLGIVPKNWSFDNNSVEPYIGTGPYRIVKDNKNWFLVVNPKYRNKTEIKIPKWRIDIIDTSTNKLPESPSDLYFLLPNLVKDQIFKKFPSLKTSHLDTKSFSFVQYSFWWLQEHFNNYTATEKKQIREYLYLLSDSIVSKVGGNISTGIIPAGIAGSLLSRPNFKKIDESKQISLKISVPQILFELLNNELKNNPHLIDQKIKLELHSYSLNEISKIKESNSQLALISYAGGFYDPEGYLSVLPSMIGRTSLDLFGKKAETIRAKAEIEFNGRLRAEYYREFSNITQEEVRYIPGWIPIFSDLRNSTLDKKQSAFRYGYKLIDYQEK